MRKYLDEFDEIDTKIENILWKIFDTQLDVEDTILSLPNDEYETSDIVSDLRWFNVYINRFDKVYNELSFSISMNILGTHHEEDYGDTIKGLGANVKTNYKRISKVLDRLNSKNNEFLDKCEGILTSDELSDVHSMISYVDGIGEQVNNLMNLYIEVSEDA